MRMLFVKDSCSILPYLSVPYQGEGVLLPEGTNGWRMSQHPSVLKAIQAHFTTSQAWLEDQQSSCLAEGHLGAVVFHEKTGLPEWALPNAIAIVFPRRHVYTEVIDYWVPLIGGLHHLYYFEYRFAAELRIGEPNQFIRFGSKSCRERFGFDAPPITDFWEEALLGCLNAATAPVPV